ncbi:MAG: LVIVD repeat-containing protein, partial [Candidatus Heimdallarchaeota archaeon]
LKRLSVLVITLSLFCSNTGQPARAAATTDTISLELIGELDTGGWSFDIIVEGNFAYISDYNNGLKIIDISNSIAPILVGNCSLSKCHNLDVADDYAYISCWENGIQIVNISDPNNPAIVSNFTTGDLYGHVQVEGNVAYASGIDIVLEILNVSDPTKPTLIGDYLIENGTTNVFHVVDDIAYLSTYDDTGTTGIELVNVAIPTNPRKISNYNSGEDTYGVFVDGTICYLGNWDNGLEVVNVTDRDNVKSLSHFYDGGNADTLVASENLVYLADFYGGFEIIDVDDLTNPVKIASFDGTITGVDIQDEFIYIVDRNTGLKILKLTITQNTSYLSIIPIFLAIIFINIYKKFHSKLKLIRTRKHEKQN